MRFIASECAPKVEAHVWLRQNGSGVDLMIEQTKVGYLSTDGHLSLNRISDGEGQQLGLALSRERRLSTVGR